MNAVRSTGVLLRSRLTATYVSNKNTKAESVGGGKPMRHVTHELSQNHERLSASEFQSLGIRDLLDARDQFHVHLAHKPNDAIKNLSFTPRAIHSPRDAAKAATDLMIFAQETMPPETICQTYNEARPGGGKSATKAAAVLDALWEKCGEQTIEVIAAGAVTLGAIWAAAWKLSGASEGSAWLTKVFDGANDLMPIYEEKDFLRSLHLKYLGQDDLPGSDAPQDPPPPPGGHAPIGAATDRGHAPARPRSSPERRLLRSRRPRVPRAPRPRPSARRASDKSRS
jgi:hypothetical protein